MIYTVTFNPALDYVIAVNHFTLGMVNRTVRESIFYGGKGINVSAMLANLGHESTALGFVAGFTGDEIERGVRTLGFHSDFIKVEKGLSRINVKLKSDQESEINGIGPEITEKDVKKLFHRLSGLKPGDVLALSGSIPSMIQNDIYERIMKELDKKEIRIAVDAEKELLLNVLQYHPFLIKPNKHELGQMFGVKLDREEEIVAYARKLQERGALNVLVSMAEDGAILIAEDGRVYKQKAAKGIVRNSVGAGDSMVAGFLAGYLEKGDYGYALKLGAACGGATAFSEGIGAREEVLRLFKTF